MDNDEFFKRAEEIFDNASCWESLENEVLKFYLLICNCCANITKDDEDFISRSYLKEKCLNLLGKHPIILDMQTCKQYAKIRLTREINEAKQKGN